MFTLLVAEIPKWITHIIEISVIDFATFEHFQPADTTQLVDHFDENIKGARNTLQNVSDEELNELFYLKNNGETLISESKDNRIGSTIYMRLNNIAVPSIYGPSADEKNV